MDAAATGPEKSILEEARRRNARPLPAVTLLLSSALALGTSLGFVAVGFLVMRRPASSHSWLASLSFAAFWHSGAVVAGSQGLRLFAAWLGADSLALVVGLEQVSTPFYCMAAASLTYYVVFLLSGRDFAVPISLYYLALYPLLRYHVALADPIGYVVTDWQVNYVYTQPLQTPGYTATLALVTLPVIGSVLAYATLARRADPATRYRIVCVTLGLGLWVGIEALAFGTGLAATTPGELLRRSMGLAAAAVVVAGHIPPAWARRRWGARALDAAPT